MSRNERLSKIWTQLCKPWYPSCSIPTSVPLLFSTRLRERKVKKKKKSTCLKQFLSTKMGKTASHTFLVWEQNYSMEITVTPSICDLTSKPIFSLTISLEKSRQAVREWILVMLKAKLLYRALQVLPSPTQPGSPSTPPWQTAPQQHSVCSLLKGRDHHWFLTKYSTVEPCWSCG